MRRIATVSGTVTVRMVPQRNAFTMKFSAPRSRPPLLGLMLCLSLVGSVLPQANLGLPNPLSARSALAQATDNAAPAQGSAPAAAVDAAPAAEAAPVGDAASDSTGTMADMADAKGSPSDAQMASIKASGPGVQFMADAIGQNRTGINMVWLLVTGFLVMFMQAGFALVETGFTRAKNAAHTMMMNFGCYFLGITGFWICGFALMYGNAGPVGNIGGTPGITGTTTFGHFLGGSLFATHGFFLAGNAYDTGTYAMFLFQMVFMDTAVTIVTGSMCERWKFSSFIVYAFFMSCVLYPLFGHWAWGGGWLSQLGKNYGIGCGYVDFAGSGVVHAVGGLCALAGAMVLGPRIGKYNKDGSANAFAGHDIPIAILGVIILGFGWFGFNPGSTFGASGAGNLRIGIVATTTMLAGAGGAISSMLYAYAKVKKADVGMICNGFLGGLVAITAPSAFVSGSVGFGIGLIAGVLICVAMEMFDKFHLDDPVGACSVHGVGGLFGVLCVGLFADGTYGGGWNGTTDVPLKGLFMGGGFGQLEAQLIGCAVLIVWAFGFSYLFFKVQDAIMGLRVRPEEELAGLDMPEMGILAYPTFPTETAYPSGTIYGQPTHTNGVNGGGVNGGGVNGGGVAAGQAQGQPV